MNSISEGKTKDMPQNLLTMVATFNALNQSIQTLLEKAGPVASEVRYLAFVIVLFLF